MDQERPHTAISKKNHYNLLGHAISHQNHQQAQSQNESQDSIEIEDSPTKKQGMITNNKPQKQPKNGLWTMQEQQKLFEIHGEYGNKWKEISRHLKGRRTDNDIKNKFYSILRKKLRKINKILGFKNSTSQVREIKPKILSEILNSIQKQSPHLILFIKNLKDEVTGFTENEKKIARELTNKITAMNKLYVNEKQQKPKYENLPMRTTRSKTEKPVFQYIPMKTAKSLRQQSYLGLHESDFKMSNDNPPLNSIQCQLIKIDDKPFQKIDQLIIEEFDCDFNQWEGNRQGLSQGLERRGSHDSNIMAHGLMMASPKATNNFWNLQVPTPNSVFSTQPLYLQSTDFTQNKLDKILNRLKKRVNKQ